MMSQDEVSTTLDLSEFAPEFSKLDKSDRDNIKELVADAVIEEINIYLDGSLSPVSGGPYKKFRKDKKPSLLYEEGELRSALDWKPTTSKTKLKIGIFDKEETPKAYNHNVGDTLPVRRFIPMEDESFKRPIISKIRSIILDEIDTLELTKETEELM
jgi:hypothetical protein